MPETDPGHETSDMFEVLMTKEEIARIRQDRAETARKSEEIGVLKKLLANCTLGEKSQLERMIERRGGQKSRTCKCGEPCVVYQGEVSDECEECCRRMYGK